MANRSKASSYGRTPSRSRKSSELDLEDGEICDETNQWNGAGAHNVALADPVQSDVKDSAPPEEKPTFNINDMFNYIVHGEDKLQAFSDNLAKEIENSSSTPVQHYQPYSNTSSPDMHGKTNSVLDQYSPAPVVFGQEHVHQQNVIQQHTPQQPYAYQQQDVLEQRSPNQQPYTYQQDILEQRTPNEQPYAYQQDVFEQRTSKQRSYAHHRQDVLEQRTPKQEPYAYQQQYDRPHTPIRSRLSPREHRHYREPRPREDDLGFRRSLPQSHHDGAITHRHYRESRAREEEPDFRRSFQEQNRVSYPCISPATGRRVLLARPPPSREMRSPRDRDFRSSNNDRFNRSHRW